MLSADPASVKNTYVIPLIIKDQKGAGKILTGTPFQEGETPALTNSDAWKILPKNLCALLCEIHEPLRILSGAVVQIRITENGQTSEKREGATIEKGRGLPGLLPRALQRLSILSQSREL